MPRLVTLALAAGLLGTALPCARAQVYPSRPITVIVPFPAGGPTDSLMRVLSEPMRKSLGQSLIIENVSGATGSLGVARVVQAAPDGYTVSIGNTATHVINGAVFNLKYDLLNDLEPVALLPSSPFLLDARTSIPAKSLQEFLAWAKASPKPLSAGTPGVGSIPQMAGILLENLTGVHLQFVPYRGAAPAMQDLIAGQIDMMFDQAGNSLPQVRAGAIRAYAVTAKTRLASSLRMIFPPFITNLTRWSSVMSASGSPETAIRSANFPFSIDPTRSCHPSASALTWCLIGSPAPGSIRHA
jgi:tripartite-type tricarboxylate transporter receptor subunit TctC